MDAIRAGDNEGQAIDRAKVDQLLSDSDVEGNPPMTRFSIASLMALILFIAVGLAALVNANGLWSGWLLLIALFSIGFAVIGAFLSQGRERCFWAGYAPFAGVYFTLSLTPLVSDAFGPLLGTTHVLQLVYDRLGFVSLPDSDIEQLQIQRTMILAELDAVRRTARLGSDPALVAVKTRLASLDAILYRRVSALQFQRVGHSLFTLLAGLSGGSTALWFYARRGRSGPIRSDIEPWGGWRSRRPRSVARPGEEGNNPQMAQRNTDENQ
jgi:hypothetical protein